MRRQRSAETSVPNGPVELVVLSAHRAVRCRYRTTNENVILRSKGFWDLAPGEIVSVRPVKQWTQAGKSYLSGEIESVRIEAGALGLVPLKVNKCGTWNPVEEYWCEEGEPIADWAKPIIARGSRPQFEMEQVLPGEDPDDPFHDPILEANDRKDAGDFAAALKLLHGLCEADLRCLDAHAHLGNLEFDHRPSDAIRQVGFRIGELSLGPGFDGVLLWGMIDNRPFLRCMQGYGLCLWRLGRFDEAHRIFERMLWLNPTDNQGVRFLIDDVRARCRWEDRSDR